MEQNTKKLRDYQVRLVTDVCRATGDVLVEQPTGSGKTVEIVTLVAMHLGRRFSHALIAAPQEQIEQAFLRDHDGLIIFPSCLGVAENSKEREAMAFINDPCIRTGPHRPRHSAPVRSRTPIGWTAGH